MPPYDASDVPDDARESVAALAERVARGDLAAVDEDFLGEAYQERVPDEVRKALGQYYTPRPVVRYVVRRVEGRLDADSVVLDPACGSGAFLTELCAALARRLADAGWDADAARRHALETQLHGVDLDEFAVHLAAVNVRLRGGGGRSASGAASPCVVVGNALVPLDAAGCGNEDGNGDADGNEGGETEGEGNEGGETDEDGWGKAGGTGRENGGERGASRRVARLFRRVRRERGGFDAVVGNPPYGVVARGSSVPLSDGTYGEAIERGYRDVTEGRTNVASLFVKRGLDLLDPDGGILAFVLPKSTLYARGFRALRRHVAGRCRIVEIADLGRAWDDVGYEQVILFLELEADGRRRAANDVRVVSGVGDVTALERGEYAEHAVSQSRFDGSGAFPIYYPCAADPDGGSIWEAVWERSIPFGEVDADVFRGLAIQSEADRLSDAGRGPDWTPILRGRHIGGDLPETGESWYLNAEDAEYVDAGGDLPRKAARLERDKIVCKRLVSSDVKIDAAYDDSASDPAVPRPYYNYDTVTNVVVEDDRFDDLYVLGVLTSDLVAAYLRDVVFARATLTMDLDGPYLDQLPVAAIPRTETEADPGQVTQADVRAVVETLAETKAALEAGGGEAGGNGDGERGGEGKRGGDAEAVDGDLWDRFRLARRKLNDHVYRAYGVDEDGRRLLADLREPESDG
ncbi:Eco57I restriction-modification methylase domain-containing protein [Halegenticoccus soli]|uniref:Eco57I restriction-modification methylase domain-containing protein n=1 Tax=Halegenticoccus soli TaxID=1985678 RepID=UPI0013041C6F|nr:N-6 DNA methylase [Halegenticoccus soli]